MKVGERGMKEDREGERDTKTSTEQIIEFVARGN